VKERIEEEAQGRLFWQNRNNAPDWRNHFKPPTLAMTLD
jgi:hypothetical protein